MVNICNMWETKKLCFFVRRSALHFAEIPQHFFLLTGNENDASRESANSLHSLLIFPLSVHRKCFTYCFRGNVTVLLNDSLKILNAQ